MSDNYINRYAVLNIIDDAIAHNASSYEGCVNEIMEFIAKIPAADARPVGKWMQKEVINLEDTTIEQMQSACCSVCGKYHTTPYSYYFSKYNYCPNCGAKMEVSEDA